jgi:hypothetical protein
VVRTELLDGPGGYPIAPDSIFYPGETVYLLFNVDGFQRGVYERVTIHWKIESLGPDGLPFASPVEDGVDAELAPQDKDWLPLIRHSAFLPSHAPGGTYQVVLTVTDELAKKTARRQFPIQVEGTTLPPAKELGIRSFTFRRGGEEGPVVEQAVFRPGETVWASFLITGYRVKDDNSFVVESELKLVDAEGAVLFVFEPQAASGAPFYPRRWLPARFRLNLDANIPTGNYAVQLLIRDKVGEQTYRHVVNFAVR